MEEPNARDAYEASFAILKRKLVNDINEAVKTCKVSCSCLVPNDFVAPVRLWLTNLGYAIGPNEAATHDKHLLPVKWDLDTVSKILINNNKKE